MERSNRNCVGAVDLNQLKKTISNILTKAKETGICLSSIGDYATEMTVTNYQAGHLPRSTQTFCLKGVAQLVMNVSSPNQVGQRLGLGPYEILAIEAGFCGWTGASLESYLDLWNLGKELADEHAPLDADEE